MSAVLEEARWTATERSMVIVGRRSMQNSLVAGVIDERLGCACHVRPIYQFNGLPLASGAMVLLDAEGMSNQDIDRHARAVLASGAYRIALMNVDEGDANALAYSPGVRGIFFRETSQENLLKGLRAMLGGAYWLPRSVLEAHFEKTRREARPASPAAVQLTRKETETLKLLVGGHSNSVIARRLGVSPHTVKTHLYNVFRKIGVRNRVQAVKWGMDHLARPAGGTGSES